MITIKTSTILKDFKGAKLKNEIGKDVVLGTVLSNVMGGKVGNPTLGWILGKKFATKEKVELKAEEVVFVKEEMTKIATAPDGWLSSLLCGQIIEILEGAKSKD